MIGIRMGTVRGQVNGIYCQRVIIISMASANGKGADWHGTLRVSGLDFTGGCQDEAVSLFLVVYP